MKMYKTSFTKTYGGGGSGTDEKLFPLFKKVIRPIFSKAKETPPLRDVDALVTQVSHGYTLRSGSARDVKVNARTDRFRSLITMRYV